MADRQITQTVLGDHNIFTGIGDINIVYQLSPAEAEDRPNLLILLNKVRRFWVQGVLEQSVYHEAVLQLGKAARPEMVRHPWEMVLELPSQASRPLPPGKNITDIFAEAGRALLILGEPGAGKTITLLQLARELIRQADHDPMQPIPVVLNLSTWTNGPVFDWLLSELSSKYQIPQPIGRSWMARQRLLLLLDGLDEVSPSRREDCVKAINTFVDQFGLPGLAVCSRLTEYISLSAYLKLSGAICLQPLTPDQIDSYLAASGSRLAGLRAALTADPVLQELAQTPLMLSVMSLAYQDLPAVPGTGEKSLTPGERRQNLFDTYLRRMFERRGQAASPYPDNQTCVWLSWLAQKMIQHSRTVFLLEELQPDWLPKPRQLWLYGFASRLVFGLIYGLLYGLNQWQFGLGNLFPGLKQGLGIGLSIGLLACLFFLLANRLGTGLPHDPIPQAPDRPGGILPGSAWWDNIGLGYGLSIGLSIFLVLGLAQGPQKGLVLGLVAGTLFGLIAGLSGRKESSANDIQPTEALSWSWSGFRRGGRYGLTAGLLTGLIVGLSHWLNSRSLNEPIGLGLGFMLLLWYLGSMLGGIKSRTIETKSFPNQGISRSVRNAFIGGLFSGFIVGLIFLLLGMLREGLVFGVKVGLSYFIIAGTVFGLLVYGGLDVIKHYTLRPILWQQGYAPLNYEKFLDYAAKLIFLRRVGGGYIFIHRMLLEHFATRGQTLEPAEMPALPGKNSPH